MVVVIAEEDSPEGGTAAHSPVGVGHILVGGIAGTAGEERSLGVGGSPAVGSPCRRWGTRTGWAEGSPEEETDIRLWERARGIPAPAGCCLVGSIRTW